MEKIKEMLTGTAGGFVGALVLLIVGIIVIRLLMKALRKLKSFEKLDQTTTRFILNAIKCTPEQPLLVFRLEDCTDLAWYGPLGTPVSE